MKKLFGNRDFYRLVFKVTLPIMLQQVLINVVGLADNLMLGQLNEDVISGVYIASKIVFVCNLAIFGSIEGVSIFFAQYFGANDKEHLKGMFNLKVYFISIVGIIAMIVLALLGKPIALLFVNDIQATIAANYMAIIAICIPFFVIDVAVGSCYREIRKSYIPTIGSLIALITNISLNYVFIFVLDMGAVGAAIATVIARVASLSFTLIHLFVTKPLFINNVFKFPKFEGKLIGSIILKSLPLFFNEIGWSVGQTTLVYAFSKVTDTAASSLSITTTLFDLFYLASLSLGLGISVIVGNTLGENKIDEVKKQVTWFITLTIAVAGFMGILLAGASPLIASLYKISDAAKLCAIRMCLVNGILLILLSLNCSIFFIIRSGGMTYIVIVFDTAFVWLIQVPIALLLANYSNLPLENQFFIVHCSEIIKLVLGTILLKSNIWIKNLTNNNKKAISA